jgi:hypothetical protein
MQSARLVGWWVGRTALGRLGPRAVGAHEIHAVARDLADLIRGIDPEAMADDRFWSTFVDDVEMGDFATQVDELRPTDKGFWR